jgi:chromosome partitioning protein
MNVFSCYSIKGGVGKTALAVNLAFHLRMQGERVLLMDLDPQGAAAFYYRVAPAEGGPVDDSEIDRDWILRSIRESDFPGLDVLPSSIEYRNIDVHLADMKKPRKQLRFAVGELASDYGAIVLDCPPNITLLAENVFRASQVILVPVIPTTLSARTLVQLGEFFHNEQLDAAKIRPFFSMVQHGKRLHRDMITELRAMYPRFFETEIPFSVDVENMGITRSPLLAFDNHRPATLAYRSLCAEIVAAVHPA